MLSCIEDKTDEKKTNKKEDAKEDRKKSKSNQKNTVHYTISKISPNRVPSLHLADQYAQGHVLALQPKSLITPTASRLADAKELCYKLWWQTLSNRCPEFAKFKKLAFDHTTHAFTAEMRQKSFSKILDLHPNNENSHHIHNMEEWHETIIPYDDAGRCKQIGTPGDHRHDARQRAVVNRMCHHSRQVDQLQGGVTTICALHGEFCTVGVIHQYNNHRVMLIDLLLIGNCPSILP